MAVAIYTACPDDSATKGADAGAALTPDQQEFKVHYAAWEEHRQEVSYSSNSNDYTSGAAFEAIVGMGKRALPMVMEKIAAGNFHMNQAAKLITGINIAPRSSVDMTQWPPITEQAVSKRWLAWWDEHKSDPQWQP
jgi:hypothetical protein